MDEIKHVTDEQGNILIQDQPRVDPTVLLTGPTRRSGLGAQVAPDG
jgi:hypothetical protein